jgi:hypothetical protein
MELPQCSWIESFAESKSNEVKHEISPCWSGCISGNKEKRSAFQQGEEGHAINRHISEERSYDSAS